MTRDRERDRIRRQAYWALAFPGVHGSGAQAAQDDAGEAIGLDDDPELGEDAMIEPGGAEAGWDKLRARGLCPACKRPRADDDINPKTGELFWKCRTCRQANPVRTR
jgi:hypothetical protein